MSGWRKRIGQWEHWPFPVFYAPLLPAWLRNYARSRSLWYFAAANPTITYGGFEGESKSEQYVQLPAHLCPKTVVVQPGTPYDVVLQQVANAGLQFPLIAKPDVGMKGILFRKLEGAAQLAQYHNRMPAAYLVQEYLDHPLEVSIFYYRMPGTDCGTITALIQKDLLQVQGNGRNTVAQLVQRNADTRPYYDAAVRHWGAKMNEVLPDGETLVLSHVANLVNGARFKNLQHLIDAQLTAVFDEISHQSQFHYGRYDIKCHQQTDLHTGKNFYILEFNGAGSVPNHVFTGTYSLGGAYAEIARHWDILYRISKANRDRGFRVPSTAEGRRFMKGMRQHFDQLKALDKTLVLS
ncbi:ATP-grasp domain-containing protein [Pseudocnuella soli]|uniref:hypothetical protein n=1 Tax=Pseudocnuella soli TaxID=2502779 RepID=UPI0010500A14|nr:hypothetical protein [Pseudocnuella soli]